MPSIININDLAAITDSYKHQSKKIVFVHGVFDLLHKGHVELLVKAKKLGDVLFVGIECDENSKIIKGKDRPIHDQAARSFVVSQLKPVDHVIIIPPYQKTNNKADDLNQFYCDIYRQLKVDIIATCVKAGKHGHLKAQHAADVSAQFCDIDSCYANNTTAVLERFKTV